jgi:RHS repeat-associated protein
MQMPGRNGGEDYRYAFNGMEQDPEVSGDGNSYTTQFRSYDPRLGRWKSLDPAMAKYPNQSPYVAFNNNPLFFTDPFGDDPPEEYAKRLLANAKFGDNAYSKISGGGQKYAFVDFNTDKNSYFFASNQKPSSALNNYYNYAMAGGVLDCGMFVSLVYAMSYKDAVGEEEFNKLFENQATGEYAFEFDQFGMVVPDFESGTTSSDGVQKQYTEGSAEQNTATADAGRADIGSLMGMTATDKTAVPENYGNENFIKVGDDQYAAFPLTNTRRNVFFTLQELQQTLQTDGGGTPYYISSIVTNPIPDPDENE